MNAKRTIITQFYVLSALFHLCGISIISAIYVTFLLKHGLSLLEVNLVNASYFLTLFICEVPTGAFADTFGRKASFVLACAFMSASMFIYGLSHGFWGFIVAEIVAAIGSTFQSGAFRAWLVDSLRHEGDFGPHTHIFARQSLISRAASAFGAIAGANLIAAGMSLPWLVGGALLACVTAYAQLSMRETYFVRRRMSWKRGIARLRGVTKRSIRYGRKHEAVRFLLVITFVQVLAFQPLNMYWQPFFASKGMPERHYGYVMTGILAALALGAFLSARRPKADADERSIMLWTHLATGAIIAAVALAPGMYPCLIMYLCHEVPRGFWDPVKENYLQQRIPSAERATIASFCNTAPYIGGCFGLVISGFVADRFGIPTAWMVSGIVILATGAYWMRSRAFIETAACRP